MTSRCERLQAGLAERGLDAFLATSDPGVFYLTGLRTHAFERFIGVLVPAAGRPVLVVPDLEADAARAQAGRCELHVWRDGEDALALVAEAAPGGRIAVEEDHLSLARADGLRERLPGARLEHGGALLAGLRLRKDAEEVERIREGGRVLARGLAAAWAGARAGMTELELQALLEAELKRGGAEEVLTSVLSGPGSALPHGRSGERRLERGHLLLIDAVATVRGYVADITRCASVGEPGEQAARLWRIVSEAHAAGVAAARPGVRAGDVDRAARAVIEAHGLGERFVHRTGHGLGLEVHEPPYLHGGNDEPLGPGMVITVEPGIYLPDVGGVRLEDDFVVTGDGVEALTDFSRELQIVG